MLKAIIILTFILSLTDGLFTIWAVQAGVTEANPIIRQLIDWGGFQLMFMAKIILWTAFSAACLYITRPYQYGLAWGIVGAYSAVNFWHIAHFGIMQNAM